LSQFLPDLFNARVTAALVAIVVWQLQVQRESRDARRRAVDDWDRLRVHLRAALAAQPVELYPGTLFYSTPATALQTFLEPHRVEEWARLLPKRADIVGLAALEREWPQLAEAQARVHGLTPSAVEATIPSGQARSLQVEAIIEMLVQARIAGESLDETSLRTLSQTGHSASEVEARVSAAVIHAELAAATQTLRVRYTTVRTASMTPSCVG
jgi:hypothetical protein